MNKIIIKTESLPGRCETCHQSDRFDPKNNYCLRCDEIIYYKNSYSILEIEELKMALKKMRNEIYEISEVIEKRSKRINGFDMDSFLSTTGELLFRNAIWLLVIIGFTLTLGLVGLTLLIIRSID
ncbi:MAG: hypothetical protein AB1489_30110 [Acidobacteriota bacterium]